MALNYPTREISDRDSISCIIQLFRNRGLVQHYASSRTFTTRRTLPCRCSEALEPSVRFPVRPYDCARHRENGNSKAVVFQLLFFMLVDSLWFFL